jgi:CRISPR type III-B/RAMP module RAMP protein Cmr1
MPFIRITAKCRIVTPMLSSGANRQKWEIRATEVKAALRFWWRAFQPDDKPKALYEKEKILFGSTEKSCSFSIFMTYEKSCISVWNMGDSVEKGEHAWGKGVGYILFSIYDQKSNDKFKNGKLIKRGHPARIKSKNNDIKKSGRPVIKPGSEFTLHIIFNGRQTEQQVGDILCSLWLLENLSGLGGRTRKGAGCFEIINDIKAQIDTESIFNQVPRFYLNKNERIEDFICSGLNIIIERWQTEIRSSAPQYTAYYPSSSNVLVLYEPESVQINSAIDMMNIIGTQLKDYCYTYSYKEAKEMHKALAENEKLPDDFKLTKAAKGLPIVYNFKEKFGNLRGKNLSSTFTATTVECDKKGNPLEENGKYKEGTGRKASPILISCHQKGDSPYAVVCHFLSPLLQEHERLWLKSSSNSDLDRFLKQPDQTFVNDLIFHSKSFEINSGHNISKSPLINAFNKCFNILPGFEHVKKSKPVPDNSKLKKKTEEKTKKDKTQKKSKTPEEILKDSSIKDKILVKLTARPSESNKFKTWSAVRLSLDDKGNISEESGWTVTKKNVQSLVDVNIGDLLIGTKNPQSSKHIDNPRKI